MIAVGGLFGLFAVGRFVVTIRMVGMQPGLLFDTMLLLIPGITFSYVGLRLPTFDIEPQQYPQLVGWFFGGVAVMFGFLVLRELHPGVSADWTVGTRAIAFTIGSVGGLLIGLQRTRARTRANQLERRNEELAFSKQELTKQNRRLETVTGIISHDLRSPLSTAFGWVELARGQDDTEDYLDNATTALSRMGELIDNTLAFARHGQTVVSTEPFGLPAIAHECWEIAGAPTAELTVVDDVQITGDRTRVKQLFENLFRNAVEHGGNEVAVTTGVVGETGVYIEDDGPGIPAASRAAVFDFGYTTSRQGTGFGLAIVAEIVEAHGWEISVVDSDTGGARFEISGIECSASSEEGWE